MKKNKILSKINKILEQVTSQSVPIAPFSSPQNNINQIKDIYVESKDKKILRSK